MTQGSLAIVTTGGSDGACCAAAGLLRRPDAPVFITSQNAVHLALQAALHLEPRIEMVQVCGVGIGDPPVVWNALSALREAGIAVTWSCGRGYLDPFKPMLSKVCTPVLERAESNTALLVRLLGLSCDERVALLLALAREYTERKRAPADHLFWHDLVQAASLRYFRFGDEEHYLRVLKTLAGLVPLDESDRQEVAHFRAGGRERPVPLGTSASMKALRELVRRLAPLEEPVLILGPTGAGKELVARALHEGSPRRDGPFQPINCAILGSHSDLARDRLFGHVAGAFTGAVKSARGAFEAAAGGTLFLDEVAELPLDVQTQLLRVLEEKTISPLGTVDRRAVDTRVIAATNRELAAEVAAGRFRADLWYRLNVLPIEVPPLKERLDDCRAIASAVLAELAVAGHKLKLTDADWKALRTYDWPGNVRQFVNLLKRTAYTGAKIREVLTQERRLAAHSGPHDPVQPLLLPAGPEEVRPVGEIYRAYMQHVLTLFGGNRARACRALGVAENTLRKWLDG